jgi:hypothetical protein
MLHGAESQEDSSFYTFLFKSWTNHNFITIKTSLITND